MSEMKDKMGFEGSVVTLKKIGNSVGVILPKDILARVNLKEGDQLHVLQAPEGELRLSPRDPVHARAMEIARQSFRDYADTYRELAK